MRLDHLLSKEHTPRCQANVLARMVVFTSGIVDGQVLMSSLLGVGVWLLMALRWWGMGSSTLLGPEGSAGPRLRVGEPLLGVPSPSGGGGVGCFWSSLCSSCLFALVVPVGLFLWGWSGWVWGCWWGCCLRSA